MNLLKKLISGCMRLPLAIQIWVAVLIILNGIVPLFFFGHLEAKLVLGVAVVNTIAVIALIALAGFTRLVGMGHALWIPLIYFLWGSLAQHPATTAFGVWLRLLMAANAASLVMDTIDVIRFLRGDRKELYVDEDES